MSIEVKELVRVLNEFVKLDREAAHALTEARVPCNDAVAAHPSIVVNDENGQRVGILGLLNGVLGPCGVRLYAHYDEAEKLERFSVAELFTPPVP